MRSGQNTMRFKQDGGIRNTITSSGKDTVPFEQD